MRSYIGIKQADGKIIPLLYSGQGGKVNLECSPARGKQKEARLHFYYVDPRAGSRKIHTLVIKELKPSQGGAPFLNITLSQEGFNKNARLLISTPSHKLEFDLELNGSSHPHQKGFSPGSPYRDEVVLKKKSPLLKTGALIIYSALIGWMVYFLITQLP